MATRFLNRSLLTSTRQSLSLIFSRPFTSLPNSSQSFSTSPISLLRLRPLVAVATKFSHISPAAGLRGFATRQTSSSLSDPNPNFSNRPPKETILLDGCDFEHWLVVMEKPEGDPTRDDIIDSYIKTLAQVVGSEQDARMKIYSVSTRHYYAFGALVSEELSYKLKELPRVRWVLPDSYLDVRNKDYGGEPFINGQAVPYDPKYHEEWVRNNARANERNRRNDRPRNFDRSRNFERRRDGQNMSGGPPGGNYNAGGGPNAGPMPPPNNMGGQPNTRGMPPNNMGGPPPHMGGVPPANMGGPPNMGGMHGNMAGPPQPGYSGGMPSNPPNYPQGSPARGGGMPYQSGPGPNQYNTYPPPPPNMGPPGGNPYQNQNMPGREMPPPPPPNMGPPGGNPYQNQNMPGRDMHPPPPPNMGPPGGNPYQNQNMPERDMPPPPLSRQNYQ